MGYTPPHHHNTLLFEVHESQAKIMGVTDRQFHHNSLLLNPYNIDNLYKHNDNINLHPPRQGHYQPGFHIGFCDWGGNFNWTSLGGQFYKGSHKTAMSRRGMCPFLCGAQKLSQMKLWRACIWMQLQDSTLNSLEREGGGGEESQNPPCKPYFPRQTLSYFRR